MTFHHNGPQNKDPKIRGLSPSHLLTFLSLNPSTTTALDANKVMLRMASFFCCIHIKNVN
jgi:hypothetical protein